VIRNPICMCSDIAIIMESALAMQITLDLPGDIADGLVAIWKDLPRATPESLALEAYRSGALTAATSPAPWF
jgi:hypothetical protein